MTAKHIVFKLAIEAAHRKIELSQITFRHSTVTVFSE